jgi:Oxidoreductase family, NAD-binding Rossmann fold/Oxidoreductase family, C-terminal alpha/beta domain
MSLRSRREFLRDSAALAALGGSGLLTSSQAAAKPDVKSVAAKGVNDTLNIAIIGVNGRGRDHVNGLAGRPNINIATICDADQAVIGRAMTAVEKAQKKAPKFEQDLRRVMDDKSIDIVTIATPNHWHALAAIWALQSGKHVYVEKPVSHNVSEGRRIVEAARRYNRVCQTGTQSRSSPGMRDAIAYVHSGKIGQVKLARGTCYKLRPSIKKTVGDQPIPSTIDYDLWCGPAPKTPLRRKHLHYDWHWFWDYGCGDLGNQGIHEMDKARWGLAKSEMPKSVISYGGRFGYEDDGQTANTQVCIYDYGDCELIFEVRGLPSVPPWPFPLGPTKRLDNYVGNIFYGTEGVVVCPSYTGGVAFNLKGEVVERFHKDGDHYGNFLSAVRNNNPSELNADILEGHLSSALCHLGNVSYRLGSPQRFSEQTKAFGDDKEAYETVAKMKEHLKTNEVAVDGLTYQLGRKLTMVGETFGNDAEANAMLTRNYRKGFEVPAKL